MRDDTADDDAAIRSLLGEVGPLSAAEALPDDVAARLDVRLRSLVAERGATDARHRRSRRGRLFLAAAAVVVVAGIGVPVVRSLGGGGQGTATSGAPASARAEAQDKATTPSGPAASGGAAGSAGIAPSEEPRPAVPALTSADFAADVRRLLATPVSARFGDTAPGSCGGTSDRKYVRREIDQRIPVTLDGDPVLLEVHVVRDGVRRVDAVTCSGSLLQTTRVR